MKHLLLSLIWLCVQNHHVLASGEQTYSRRNSGYMPKVCNQKRSSYALSNAVSDNYSKHNSNHSIWLSGFNGGPSAKLTFDKGAYLTYSHDGKKAFITGKATMTQGNLKGSRWKVHVPFSAKTSNMKPKKELRSSAYNPNQGGVDIATWDMFKMKHGAYMYRLDRKGYIRMRRMPADGKYGLQVGKGASGKNVKLGASTWFYYSYNRQREKQGDINVDISPLCSSIEVSNTCTENPNKIKWAIRNNGNIGVQAKIRLLPSGTERIIWIPRAGKGKELVRCDGDFSYTFITTHVQHGTTIQVITEPAVHIEYEAQAQVCQTDGIEVAAVCSNNKEKHKWRIKNPNTFSVLVQYSINGTDALVTKRLPAAGRGFDLNGNARSGDYTFITTPSTLGSITLKYGNDQVISKTYTSGPCSIRKMSPNCSVGQRSFRLSSAVFDTEYSKSTNTHSFYLSKFNGGGLALLQFNDDAYLTYSANGKKAYVHGTATMSQGNMKGSTWEIFMPYERKKDIVEPKIDLLKPAALDPNDGGVDPSIWKYFTLTDEAFIRQTDGDAYIHLRTMPSDGRFGLQIGKGANLKNIEMGASTWFFYTLNDQDEKAGDMNVTLAPLCPSLSTEVSVTSVCNNNPNWIRYAIKNNTNRGTKVIARVLPDGKEKIFWLPRSGKGKELVPGDGDFSYKFVGDKVSEGTTFQLTLVDEVITYEGSVNVCFTDNITLTPLCSDLSDKNKWAVVNPNDHAVAVTYKIGDVTKRKWLRSAGNGMDIDGNPKSGNYTFIQTPSEITTLRLSYGANQSIEATYSIGTCQTPICSQEEVTYTLSNGVSDSYHLPYVHDHGLWFSDFNGVANTIMTFNDDAYLTYSLDGSKATVYGTATVTSGDQIGTMWEVYMPFGPAASNTIPKTELVDRTAYEATGGGADTTLWDLFLLEEGGYIKQQGGTGSISMTKMPTNGIYGLQIGKGANGKNIQFGAGGWFFYDYNDQGIKQADINVNLETYCPPEVPCIDFAAAVVSYDPGTLASGFDAPVSERQLVDNALGAPQENETINFLSLGFGGELVLELSSPVYDFNRSGINVGNTNSIDFGSQSLADLIIVETTYGYGVFNCGLDKDDNYPEKVRVFGKQDLGDSLWIELGSTEGECRTSLIDVAPAMMAGLAYVKYLKLVDVTDASLHVLDADGYDVDGVIICPDEVTAAISGVGRSAVVNARQTRSNVLDKNFFNREPNEPLKEASLVRLYPNPTNAELNFLFANDEVHQVQILDVAGVIIANFEVLSGDTYDVSRFNTGVYLVSVSNSTRRVNLKFEKR